MYEMRKMTQTDRKEMYEYRKTKLLPWHSPPHFEDIRNTYLITASNFNHAQIIGNTFDRLTYFQNELLDALTKYTKTTLAWCVLYNHYHVLIVTDDLKYSLYGLGQLHGRTSRYWNLEDKTPGRKCWYRCCDRLIRTERHLYATVNYVHYNPVKHGCVDKIDQWEFSSAKDFLSQVGRIKATEIWKQYPILDYGKNWDDEPDSLDE